MAPTKRTAQDDGPYPAGPSKSRAREASDLSRPPHLGSGLSALELANRVNGPKAAGDAQNADDIDPATGERVGVRFEPPPLGFSDEHAVLTIEQQLGWQSVPHDVLNTYRWAHRLATPMPWHDKLHAAVLTNKGIGRHSPTAIAHLRSKRQQMLDKDGLLAANGGGAIAKGDGPRPAWRARAELVGKVRRHFNAMPADETVAAVELIYKVRNQGTCETRDIELSAAFRGALMADKVGTGQGFRMRSVQKKAAAPNASAAVVTMTTTSGL